MTCGGIDQVHEPFLLSPRFILSYYVTSSERSEGTPEWGTKLSQASSLNEEILRRKLLRMTCGGVDQVHEPPLTLTSFYSFLLRHVIPNAVRELLNGGTRLSQASSLNQEILRRKLLRMTCSGVDEVHESSRTLTSFYSFLLHHVIPNAVRELLNGAPDYRKYSSLNQEILRRKLLRMTCSGIDEVHEPPLTLTSFYSFLLHHVIPNAVRELLNGGH